MATVTGIHGKELKQQYNKNANGIPTAEPEASPQEETATTKEDKGLGPAAILQLSPDAIALLQQQKKEK